MKPLKLVVLTAGLSVPSTTRLLADRVAEAVSRDLRENDQEVQLRMIELRELAADVAHNLVTGFPSPTLREALAQVTGADGLIAVSPIFSASYSGLFKSFIDVIEKDGIAGKPVLIAATGGTERHSLALEHAMRPLFAYLRSIVVPTAVYAASSDWGSVSDTDASLMARIDRAAGELAVLMGARPPAGPGTDDVVVPFEQQLAAVRGR